MRLTTSPSAFLVCFLIQPRVSGKGYSHLNAVPRSPIVPTTHRHSACSCTDASVMSGRQRTYASVDVGAMGRWCAEDNTYMWRLNIEILRCKDTYERIIRKFMTPMMIHNQGLNTFISYNALSSSTAMVKQYDPICTVSADNFTFFRCMHIRSFLHKMNRDHRRRKTEMN